MNYSTTAKNQIVSLGFSTDCCKLAFLSAVIHTAGSVFIRDKQLTVEICSENELLLQKVDEILREFYGVKPKKNGKRRIDFSGAEATAIMFDCGIFGKEGEHIVVLDGILPSVIVNKCCRVNYLRGAFLGAGSLSTNKGYHLEFGVSNPVFAKDFSKMLEELGVPVKIIVREKKIMVYAKGSTAVCDCLALMGASEAVIEITQELAYRDVRRTYNRRNNCEYANIGKTVDAAVKQIEAINFLTSQKDYLLPERLQATAEARINNPEASFSELAELLELPKSTVKNRLNRLVELAERLKGEQK